MGGAPRVRDGGTASAFVLRPILSFAATRGVDTAALLAELGVAEAELTEKDRRIPDAIHERVWREASARSQDPLFGLHVAEHVQIGAYDVLDYALRFSETLKEAFERMAMFHRLLCDALATSVEIRGDAAHVRRLLPDHGWHSAEAFFGYLVLRARELAGPDLALREVKFMQPAPRDIDPHTAFFRCPLRFRCSAAELVFDARAFRRNVQVAAPGLATVLDRYMDDLVARLPAGDSHIDRARRSIGAALRTQRRPTLEETARALKASPRTLQRWLTEHGTTHREILEDVRRELAVSLLEEPRLSITEISFLLGFAGVRGFQRTFKRWTGSTPSSRRHQAA